MPLHKAFFFRWCIWVTIWYLYIFIIDISQSLGLWGVVICSYHLVSICPVYQNTCLNLQPQILRNQWIVTRGRRTSSNIFLLPLRFDANWLCDVGSAASDHSRITRGPFLLMSSWNVAWHGSHTQVPSPQGGACTSKRHSKTKPSRWNKRRVILVTVVTWCNTTHRSREKLLMLPLKSWTSQAWWMITSLPLWGVLE